jgi:hypothetical protein
MWYIIAASAGFIAGYLLHGFMLLAKRLDKSYEKHAAELENFYHEN